MSVLYISSMHSRKCLVTLYLQYSFGLFWETCNSRQPRAKQRVRMPFEFKEKSICFHYHHHEKVSIKSYLLVLVRYKWFQEIHPVDFGVWNFMTIWLKWAKFLVRKLKFDLSFLISIFPGNCFTENPRKFPGIFHGKIRWKCQQIPGNFS